MVNYRRNFLPGGTFFFTVTLHDRRSNLLVKNIDLLRESFQSVQHERPFEISTIVILPEHIHSIWTLPKNDKDYSTRWKLIKSRFTKGLTKSGYFLNKNDRGECNVWQKRYWEHTIRNDIDLQRHVDYIHFNPVKHDLVKSVKDWPYSSFHRYVSRGHLPNDWGATTCEGMFGERK